MTELSAHSTSPGLRQVVGQEGSKLCVSIAPVLVQVSPWGGMLANDAASVPDLGDGRSIARRRVAPAKPPVALPGALLSHPQGNHAMTCALPPLWLVGGVAPQTDRRPVGTWRP